MWESEGILRPEAQAEGLSIPEVIFLKTEKYFPFKEQVCGCFAIFGKMQNNRALAPLWLSRTCVFPDPPVLEYV